MTPSLPDVVISRFSVFQPTSLDKTNSPTLRQPASHHRPRSRMAHRIDHSTMSQTATSKSAFTPPQILHYLRHISFPLSLSQPRDAGFLQTLHRCQITKFPYENLSLHYNPSHSNSIDPQDLYAKFLPDFASPGAEYSRGRGGFCFETCVFFLHILRGLGFTAYPTSARIRIRDHFTRVPSGPFVGPRHGEQSSECSCRTFD